MKKNPTELEVLSVIERNDGIRFGDILIALGIGRIDRVQKSDGGIVDGEGAVEYTMSKLRKQGKIRSINQVWHVNQENK